MRGSAEHPEGVQISRRFQIRRDQPWRPLLALFGATAGRSYVEIDDDTLHVRYGWLVDKRFSLAEVASVRSRRWPWYYGIGWRSNLVGIIGLTGSLRGCVELAFRRRRWVWMLFPLPMSHLCITLEEPDAFIEALQPLLEG